MPLVLVGVNHKNCPIEIREKFFIQSTEKDLLLAEYRNDPRVLAVFVLSTCNRTEIYADLLSADPKILLDRFFSVKGIAPEAAHSELFYIHHEKDVVSHLFRVVTGLESLILGEQQILGQVKCAVAWAQSRRMLNRTFNILTNFVVETGKKVRRDTLIDAGGSSISWAAVAATQNILGPLDGKSFLVIGSGKMGQLAVQELKNKGISKIFIMNRTYEKAQELAKESGAQAVPFWQLRETLAAVDGCICSTRAPHFLLDKELMHSVMADCPRKQFAAVDISVPRNIDPHVASVKGVSLVTVDDLAFTVQDTAAKRQQAVAHVEQIIDVKIAEFYKALDKASMYEMLNMPSKADEAFI
jgi:glutamyl-tRNA reductase